MKGFKLSLVGLVLSGVVSLPALAQNATPGSTPATALENCQALQNAGVALSGTYWIRPGGSYVTPRTAYCDMETDGGGWTLVYNSVLGVNVTDFWRISFWNRFGQRGQPRIESLYYDGGLYLYGKTYMDVIEDLQGTSVVVLVADSSGIDASTMRFISPRYLAGHTGIFEQHFAGGWSSYDFDRDNYSSNCATLYAASGVTQHYGNCWVYNLGADADSNTEDGRAGPHLNSSAATTMGLSTDGSGYTRVRRISRYVKW